MTHIQHEGALKLLEELRLDSKLGKSKHFCAGDRNKIYHNIVSAISILINVFIGTILLTLLTSKNSYTDIFTWLATICSFFGALISASHAFFKFNEAYEGHRRIANQYLSISRRCKSIISKNKDIPYSAPEIWDLVQQLQQDYLQINIEAEQFPTNKKDLKAAQDSIEITPFKEK